MVFQDSVRDYDCQRQSVSVSLLFVMFYGGFGTNLKTAKTGNGEKAFFTLPQPA